MKKIYISADIEGIWGNANPAYTMAGSELYEEYRLNMINEVNLVIDLLFKYGAKEVVVMMAMETWIIFCLLESIKEFLL